MWSDVRKHEYELGLHRQVVVNAQFEDRIPARICQEIISNNGLVDSTNRTFKKGPTNVKGLHNATVNMAREPSEKNTPNDPGDCFQGARVLIQRIHVVKQSSKRPPEAAFFRRSFVFMIKQRQCDERTSVLNEKNKVLNERSRGCDK